MSEGSGTLWSVGSRGTHTYILLATGSQWIVLGAVGLIVVGREEVTEPDCKFKVIREATLDQLVHRDGGQYLSPIKANLEFLEVGNVFIFLIREELDAVQIDQSGKEHVHHVAVGSPGAQVLDLADPALERVVAPLQNVLTCPLDRRVFGDGHVTGPDESRHFGLMLFRKVCPCRAIPLNL